MIAGCTLLINSQVSFGDTVSFDSIDVSTSATFGTSSAGSTVTIFGNLGLGTASPQSMLDISGTSNTSGQAWFSYGNTNMARYSWTGSALTTNSIEIVNNNATATNSSPTLAFHRYGSGGPQFRLDATGTNVLYLESAGANSARNPYPYGGGSNSYFSRFHVDGMLSTSGNVGIGTTTPGVKLDLLAGHVNINISGTQVPLQTFSKTPAIQIVGGGDENNPATIGLLQTSIGIGNQIQGNTGIDLVGTRSALSSINVRSAVANNDVIGAIRYVGDDGYSLRTFGAYIAGVVNTSVQPVSSGVVPMELQLVTKYQAPITFRTNSSEAMRITSNGNVGIGTATPQSKLDIVGGGKFTDVVNLYNGTGASSPSIVLDPVNGRILLNGQSLLTPNASGNVGIGTSTPTAKVTVQGNASGTTFQTTNSNGVQKFTVDDNGDISTGAPTAAHIQITATGGSQALAEYYQGAANPRWAIGRDLLGGGMAGLGFGSDAASISATGSAIGEPSQKTLALYTSDGTALNERMRIDAGGNVGIGTTTPQAKLHVYNSAVAAASGNEVLRIGTLYDGTIPGSGGYISFTDAGNTALGQIRSTLEANGQVGLSFSTYNSGLTESVRISNSGNVGIGTPTPQAKLDVNGDAKVSGTATISGAATMSGSVTMSGPVTIVKRQGDIVMGVYGNGNGD